MKCKKRIVLFMLLVICFFACACDKRTRVDIHEEVKCLMEKEKISNCCIVCLCDYKKISKYLNSPKVSDEDLDQYLKEELEFFSEEKEEMILKDMGYSSKEEFEKVMREQYIEHLKIMEIFNARDEVLNELIDNSKFEYDDKEVADFAQGIVYSYENEAMMYGYTELEPYVQEEMNMTMDQFLEMCLEKSKREISTYLVVGAIAEQEKIENEKFEDIYETYLNLENSVYDLFIDSDDDF